MIKADIAVDAGLRAEMSLFEKLPGKSTVEWIGQLHVPVTEIEPRRWITWAPMPQHLEGHGIGIKPLPKGGQQLTHPRHTLVAKPAFLKRHHGALVRWDLRAEVFPIRTAFLGSEGHAQKTGVDLAHLSAMGVRRT